ncbi:MAG: putative transglutaminase-like cysteine proteinase [Candidatus Pseudothioglobus sp.]|jgi:predicted transglutaminase-like cysteine proteinase
MALLFVRPSQNAHVVQRTGYILVCLWLAGTAVAGGLGITTEMLAMVASEYGRSARGRVIEWQSLIDNNMAASELDKLRAVNRFFNRNRFLTDLEHWHKEDYWATPIEFISTKGGDCEDFAIAKYITLRALEIPDEKLRITYVKSLRLNQAHMVLTYYSSPRDVPLVLDNLIMEIKPADRRTDLEPVYSFNGDGLWTAKMRGEGQRVGGPEDLDMWRDFIGRMQREKDLK